MTKIEQTERREREELLQIQQQITKILARNQGKSYFLRSTLSYIRSLEKALEKK